MKRLVLSCLLLCSVSLLLSGSLALQATAQARNRVDFDREVRPILSENCFRCHGFDVNQRRAGLRLDIPEGPFTKLDSGKQAIVPGKSEASPLIQRVIAQGPLVMPPAGTGKKLTAAQIATLKLWVAQGAKYAQHWSFVKPERPPLPTPLRKGGLGEVWKTWPHNDIDRFILAKLEQTGLRPSPTADRVTLIRRLSFDLTGLPPTLAEVDAFVADKSKDAYEKLVDRLLNSPHYGERMAMSWLDLARYADTHGYHIDSQRDMWRWREWVISAFNANKPFDQFTIEQLAGDLLPNATLDQKIATGFNRNHPINFEGGAIPEEYQAAYIFDRIDTTSTTWMGLTMRCAQCHDHKYDPITQKDFYRFYSFFNNVTENGLDGQQGNAAPFLKAPSPEQQEQMAAYTKKVAEMEAALKTRAAEAAPALAEWEKQIAASQDKASPITAGLIAHYGLDETTGEQVKEAGGQQVAGVVKGKAAWAAGKFGNALTFDGTTYVDLGTKITFERTDKFSYGAWVYPTTMDHMTILSRMDDATNFRGWDLYVGGGKVFAHLIHDWEKNVARVNTKNPIEVNKWTHLFVTYDGSSKAKGIKIYVNGKPAELELTHDSLTETIQTTVPVVLGRRNPAAPFKGMIDEARIYNRELSGVEVEQLAGFETIRQILVLSAEKRSGEQKEALTKYFLESQDEPYKKLNVELADWRKKQGDLDRAIPTTMVMQETEKPRDTFMLVRGQYDKKGDKVTSGLPSFLTASVQENPVKPFTRLDLARWLTDPSHPLTARVAVNRYWQGYFGMGLVKTAEDFGTQGERPSHPQLLDWLATEFIRTSWDIKAMQKLIVTSATYRQASRVSKPLLEKDPENRLLARFPRTRLPAEAVRDQALAISGLLVDKIGGPSVKPYQPPGLWEELAFGGGFSAQTYQQGHGEDLYRRSMYTFWKRTCPPPSLQTFDAPEREFCMVRRSVTNTPLQALVLMNDPTYVEASRKLAERMMTEGGTTPQERLNFAYRLALARLPNETERTVLLGIFNKQLAMFRKDTAGALKLLGVGEAKRNETLDAPELAAWASVAGVLLNLDETITKH